MHQTFRRGQSDRLEPFLVLDDIYDEVEFTNRSVESIDEEVRDEAARFVAIVAAEVPRDQSRIGHGSHEIVTPPPRMRSDDRPALTTGIVDGEMFGAPVPGEWPGASTSDQACETSRQVDEDARLPKVKRRRWTLLRRRRPDDDSPG